MYLAVCKRLGHPSAPGPTQATLTSDFDLNMQQGGKSTEEVQLRASLEEERSAVLTFLYSVIDLVFAPLPSPHPQATLSA